MYARTRLRQRETVVSATEKAPERRDCNTCIARECYGGACGGVWSASRAGAICVYVCVYSVRPVYARNDIHDILNAYVHTRVRNTWRT